MYQEMHPTNENDLHQDHPKQQVPPVAIDIDTIETQKENIQPLSSGRSAAQLSSLFNHHHPPRTLLSTHPTHAPAASGSAFNPLALAEYLRQGHANFMHQIEVLEKATRKEWGRMDAEDVRLAEELLNDPLEIYVKYVRWTVDSYPAGGTTAESKLIPLLEQATRQFVKDGRYQQDVRYLKLWIYYARQVENRSARTIFSFLLHHRIGTTFSALYEEYAQLFSQPRTHDERVKLEQILRFGIKQTTSPDNQRLVDRLDALLASPPTSEDTQNPKPAVKRMVNTAKKNKIKIFDDAKAAPELDPPGSLITRWDDIGTVSGNRRQNTVDPVAWKGQKLPMKSPAASNRAPKMKIYEDNPAMEEESSSTNGLELASPSSAPQNSTPITTQLSESSTLEPQEPCSSSSTCSLLSSAKTYELLKSDPLLYHTLENTRQ